jgi:hypothetical protein
LCLLYEFFYELLYAHNKGFNHAVDEGPNHRTAAGLEMTAARDAIVGPE